MQKIQSGNRTTSHVRILFDEISLRASDCAADTWGCIELKICLRNALPAFTSLWQMQAVTAALPAFTSLYGTRTSLAEALAPFHYHLEYEVFAY